MCKWMLTTKVHCEDWRYSGIVVESITIETKYLVVSHFKQGKIPQGIKKNESIKIRRHHQ